MKKLNAVLLLTFLFFVSSCVTQKREDDISGLKKFYHNTTSEFNGYFNADVIMQETILALNDQHAENYNQILPVYSYVAAKDPKPVSKELDRAIEKVSVVVSLHRVSDWTDDCYLLMGQAQYLKKDYESAEETFEYMMGEFNPETLARQRAKYAKQYSKKARKGGKKVKEKEVSEAQREREDEKKEKQKTAKQIKKEKEKAKKLKNKETKKRKKAKKKGKKYKSSSSTKPSTAKTDKITGTTPKPVDKSTAKIEDEKNKKQKTPTIKPDEEKAFKREPAYQEAQLWLARTYVEREKFDRADNIFTALENGANTYSVVHAELAPARAHYFFKQKKYEQAIPHLEQAIELTKDRQEKARYAYILAQLYQRQKNSQQALAYFQKVRKYSNAYEMEFNAQLSMAQNEYRTGKATPEASTKKLERFLKDSKNIEYKDQIYFALSNVAIESNQPIAAITYLEQSLEANSGNIAQKGETLIALADLYYEQDTYVDAKKYYDQALQITAKSDERYTRIERLSKNLVEIAQNMELVNLKDSLLMISGLDDKARKKLAAKLKAENDEAIAKKDSPSKMLDKRKGGAAAAQSVTLSNGSRTGGLRSAPSTFPFYNEKSSKKGQRDFERIWNDRKLSDDWRRSNRPGFADLEVEEETEEDTNSKLTDSQIEQIFKDVPKTEAEKDIARGLIQDAMIKLGQLFRERIERDDKAVEMLEDRLLVEYPRTKHELDAWYYLFLSHTNLTNTVKATEYKDKLVGKYPTSTFAKILSDPNYAAELMNKQKKIETYYDETYGEYEKGNFKGAYDRTTKVSDLFGKDNPLKARFALLSAICTGSISGKDAYIIELKEVIAKHPGTAEQTRAKEILRLLEGRGGNPTMVSAADEEEASKKYIAEPDKLHYMLIVITDKGEVKVNDAKSSLAGFNRLNNKLDKLRISNIYLGTDTNRPIMVVRKFNNQEKAMIYYDAAAAAAGGDFIPDGMTYEMYPITQNNYRQILKDKSIEGYGTFFEANYLK